MTNEYIQSTFQIRKLESDERIESFDCGDADLNDFILNESLFYREALLAVSYVFEDKATGEVAAYFSLANDRVSLSDFADKTEFNRFRRKRFPNEKRMKAIRQVNFAALSQWMPTVPPCLFTKRTASFRFWKKMMAK